MPLSFRWSMEPLDDTLEELVTTGQDPVYVVHFTQAAAVEHATNLLKSRLGSGSGGLKVDKDAIAERIGAFRFGAGFGKTLSQLVRNGIGVHHAGMLPKYRRLVETLAQSGLLRVICGTDTLGVGINVPIRTVLFTGLAKFDGNQAAGAADAGVPADRRPGGSRGLRHGRLRRRTGAGVRHRERAGQGQDRGRAQRRPARRSRRRSSRSRPRARSCGPSRPSTSSSPGVPERLTSRMKVDNAMLVNVVSREEDAFAVMRRLLTDNHEDRRGQLRLARRALRLARSLGAHRHRHPAARARTASAAATS